MEEFSIEKSEELAYWLGLAQADGYFDIKHKILRLELVSFSLVERFKQISEKYLGRTAKIQRYEHRGTWCYVIGIGKLIKYFERIGFHFKDPPFPPGWISSDIKLFGAYIAGLIDGDGHVQIKRPKYPQCVIKIASSKKQIELQKLIEEKFECSSYIYHAKNKKLRSEGFSYWFSLEFYVSKKTFEVIEDYIIPWIKLDYKRLKIEDFIRSRYLFAGVA